MAIPIKEIDIQEITVTAKVLNKTSVKLTYTEYLYFICLQQYNRMDTDIKILVPSIIYSYIFPLLEINKTYKFHLRAFISDTKIRYQWIRIL